MSRLGIREIAFLVGLVVIPMVVTLKVIKPQKEEAKQLNEEIAVWKENTSSMAMISGPAFKELKKDIEVLKSTKEIVLARIPYVRENNQTTENLSELIRSHNLRTVEYKPFSLEDIVPNEGTLRPDQVQLVRQRMAYTLQGTFKDFYRLLQAIEQLPQIIHVENFTCELAKGQGAGDQVKVKLDLTFFFRYEAPKEKADG